MSNDDEQFAAMAIEQAGKCEAEDDAKPRPRVGAVVVSADGKLLGSSYRGERVEADQGSGDHAEYVLLGRKLKGRDLQGATLYTTLEPCVKRSPHKTPCATRVIESGISRVVVGMLDPNPDITGRGYWQLRRAGVVFSLFSGESQARAESQNAGFSDPYRRFDTLFVSDILEQSAGRAAMLVHTMESLKEMLELSREALETAASSGEQVRFSPEQRKTMDDSSKRFLNFARRSAMEVRRTLEHIDAMGHSSEVVTSIRSMLAEFENGQKPQ